MKRGMIRAWAVLLLAATIGCSPSVVGIYNSEQVKKTPKSFYVYPLEGNESISEEQAALDLKLVSIISKSLEAKGLVSSSIPDLYISFMINVHTAQEINNNNLYNRYDYYRYYNYGYMDPYYNTNRTYKEGVFIIDIRNQNNKLVWQGSKSFKLKSKGSVQQTLPEICNEVIASFDLQKL